MSRLFEHYENLAVDTSGLPFDVLCLLAEYFDQEKVVFGSDALYEKQWMAMVKLWYALRKTAPDAEEAIVRITSENPSRLFPAGDTGTKKASTRSMPIFVNVVRRGTPGTDSPLRH
jgi:predicted TIM-barrel fold metal-dependent hydrolase